MRKESRGWRTQKTAMPKACGKRFAGIAAGLVMAAATFATGTPMGYGLTTGYGPEYAQSGLGASQAGSTQDAVMEGVTAEEEAMIEDIYNGFLASRSGSYQTEKFYRINANGNWLRALEVCYFHSDKPRGMKLYYQSGDIGACQALIEIPGTDMETFRKKEAAYNAEVARIVSEVEGKSTEEKVRYFHDYIVQRCEYDYTHAKSRPYDCLIDGQSVCNGYAAAFYNLCAAVGLETNYIAGTVEAENQGRIIHAWNRVKAEDGQWRYYDVTFDDNTRSYQYYGITEEEMDRDHFPEQII